MSHTCKVHGCNEVIAANGLCWDHWEMLVVAESASDFIDEETALFEFEHQEEGWPSEPLELPLHTEAERQFYEEMGWRLNWVSVETQTESWSPPIQ